jgi:hypothetical protein
MSGISPIDMLYCMKMATSTPRLVLFGSKDIVASGVVGMQLAHPLPHLRHHSRVVMKTTICSHNRSAPICYAWRPIARCVIKIGDRCAHGLHHPTDNDMAATRAPRRATRGTMEIGASHVVINLL